MRPGQNLDLRQLPSLDLAIECNLTSQTLIQAYEAIQVPEVWIYAQDRLTIYLYLDPDGYTPSPTSQIFPDLPICNLVPQPIATAFQI